MIEPRPMSGHGRSVVVAFPRQPYDPDSTTVEYSRGHGRDKALHAGERVEVKDGMIFDVELGNRS